MKKLVSLLLGVGLTLAVAAPASAESLWCEIKRNVCDKGSTNPVCQIAYANCPN